GDNVDFSNTDGNVEIAKTDSGTDHDITVDLADDIDVSSVTAGNSTLDTSGLTVDDGSGNVTTTGATGTTVTDAGGNTTTVASTGTTISDGAGNSVTTTPTGTTMTDGTNTTTYDADGLAITGGPVISSAGIDAGGKKVTNVADGDVNSTSTDAVNGSQLYDVQQTANAGWNVGVNGGTTAQVKPGDNVDFSNTDGNVEIAKTDSGTDHDITVDLADDID